MILIAFKLTLPTKLNIPIFFQLRTLLIESFISHRGTLIIWHHRTPIIVTSTSFSLPQKFQSSSKGPPLKQQKFLVPPDRQSRLCFWNNSAINSDERMKKATQTKRWSFSRFFPFTLQTSRDTLLHSCFSRLEITFNGSKLSTQLSVEFPGTTLAFCPNFWIIFFGKNYVKLVEFGNICEQKWHKKRYSMIFFRHF